MTDSEAPLLSVIVVNFETPERVIECLESVQVAAHALQLRQGRPVEVIVVDNGSQDGSASVLGRLDASAGSPRLLALPSNRGFAAGANAGLEAARGDFLLLLNSDAVVEAQALVGLIAAFEADPQLGMAGAQLLHPDGRLQNAAHPFPSVVRELLPLALLQILMPRRFPSKRFVHSEPYPVDAVQGAALMVRRAVVERIGPLSEAYFFFLEETDWCRRARAAGYGIVVVPGARVVHQGGASSKQRDSARTRIEFERSLNTYFTQHSGRHAAGLIALIRFIRALMGLILPLPLMPFSVRIRGRLRDRCAILRWYAAGRPADGGLEGAFGGTEPSLRLD